MFYNLLYLISGFNRYVRLCHVRVTYVPNQES